MFKHAQKKEVRNHHAHKAMTIHVCIQESGVSGLYEIRAKTEPEASCSPANHVQPSPQSEET